MRIRLNFKNLKKTADLEDFFNKRLDLLKHHLQGFEDELLHLHGTIEKNPHRNEFYSSFSLYLPQVVFHCRAKANEIFASISDGFVKLASQIEKRRSRLKTFKRRS